MWAPKSSPYSKSNSFWPLFSTGIASLIPRALACSGTSRRAPELLVHERAGHRGIGTALERRLDPLEDQMLAVGEALDVLGRGIALDAEALDEGPAVVEREDVELAGVAEFHFAQAIRFGRIGTRGS